MTLDEFISSNWERGWPRSAYVREPGFEDLYVRRSYRCGVGCSEPLVPVLDIARVEASHPGNGAFKKLIARLHPTHNLFVESVLSVRFEEGLQRMGFTKQKDSFPPCYYLLTTDPLHV